MSEIMMFSNKKLCTDRMTEKEKERNTYYDNYWLLVEHSILSNNIDQSGDYPKIYVFFILIISILKNILYLFSKLYYLFLLSYMRFRNV